MKARRRDRWFEDVYRRNVDAVYRLCASYVGLDEAEDATQITFAKLVARPIVFADERHERAWLCTCAANHCKDVLKSATHKKRGPLLTEPVDQKSRVETDEVWDAITRLPDKYKLCVFLHYYCGYTAAEIADDVGLTSSGVRSRLAEARRLLRERLEI